MIELKPYSLQRLQELNPQLKPLVEKLIDIAQKMGLNVQISCGFRSLEAQQALYDQGRTRKGPIVTNAKPGESAHNYAAAVDLFFLKDDGKASFDERLYRRVWEACVKQGLDKQGLRWSGNWQGFKEVAHFELADWKKLKPKAVASK